MGDQKQEDLDMLFIMKSIKMGVLNLIKSVIWLFEFSIKKSIYLLVFIIIGVGISLGLFFMQKPYYVSELSVYHTRLENNYCYEMIHNLDLYIDGTNDNASLAEKLGIDIKVAKEVKKVTYYPINQNVAKAYADSISVLLPFKVQVEVYNNDVLKELQKGILNYLESNEYALQLKEIEKESLDKIEIRVKDEIVEMDSLKHIINKSIIPRSTGTGIILGEPIDPVTVYSRAMNSYEHLIDLNKKKILNNSFYLMVGFDKSDKKAGHSKVWYVFIGFLSGYIIGLFFLLRKKIKLSYS